MVGSRRTCTTQQNFLWKQPGDHNRAKTLERGISSAQPSAGWARAFPQLGARRKQEERQIPSALGCFFPA